MSSIKNVCGRGGLRGGSTYLKRERLGLGLVSLLYPSRVRVGFIFVEGGCGLALW